jgi:hypothetical protein
MRKSARDTFLAKHKVLLYELVMKPLPQPQAPEGSNILRFCHDNFVHTLYGGTIVAEIDAVFSKWCSRLR